MENKPITFRKLDDNSPLPDLPAHFLDDARKLYDHLNGSDTLPDLLGAIYSFMDKLAPFVASFTTCSKGCSHCCNFDVQLTTFEAEYIYIKTGIPYSNTGELTVKNRTACPFLKYSGECGIYPVRPIKCRTHHALGDPDVCADPEALQSIYSSKETGFGNDIYANLARWVHFQNSHIEGGKILDIRGFFPHQRSDVQAYLEK